MQSVQPGAIQSRQISIRAACRRGGLGVVSSTSRSGNSALTHLS